MKNGENSKEVWLTPEIYNLSSKNTKGGAFDLDREDGTYQIPS